MFLNEVLAVILFWNTQSSSCIFIEYIILKSKKKKKKNMQQ